MSQTTNRRPPPDYAGSSWAAGASVFAASIMIVAGVLQFFQGLVAVIDGTDFLLRTRNYVFQFDASTWGWTHLVLGILVAATGVFVLAGNPFARGVGIGLVCLSAVLNFLWIPYYPLWALVVLTLDVFVIWGLANINLGDR